MKTVSLLQSCLVVGLVKVSGVLADPSTYFGGADHDVYMDWITNDLLVGSSNSRYPHSFFLNSAANASLGVAVHYRLDAEKSSLHLALAARADGWLSFGHSENGGMSGSDILIYEAANPDVVIDAYVLEERLPIVDDCASNWILHSSNQEAFDEGFIMIEVSRALVTGDLQDHVVFNDTDLIFPPHRVIAAWGDEPNYGYHGLVNRARSSVRWFNDNPNEQESFSDRMEKEASGFFEVRSNNYTVKPIETEYAEFCFDYDDLIGMGVPADIDSMSMIAFEAIVDPRAAKHVHHFTVYGTSVAKKNGTQCGEDNFGMVFVWAPGDVPFELPSDMGFPLGPANVGYRSFRLQIHFDNPELVEGVIDNSGVRIFYVNSSRPIQAGMLELGDPNVQLYGEPVGRGISEHTLECGGGCSALVLPTSGVTVIRSHLHMHKTGIQASTEHIRNGTVVNKATVEFFDFAQQGIQSVQAGPYKVLPGDSFRVQCRYRTPTNDTEIIFGTASSDEMCISYLLYYPRQMIEELGYPWLCGYRSEDPCSADYSSRELDDNDELDRIFGSPMPRVNVELQADTPDSFNNSLMCPLVVSPPLDNDSSTSNNDDGSASRATFSAVPFAAFLGSAIVSMQLLL